MEEFKNNPPLVSVVVITYFSSKTIVETLDSIYRQTYKNIELIISDDGSKDDTISKCQEWLNRHAERFVSTSIVTTEVNTGTAANVNRGVKKASGDWIKSFAGDDIMLDDGIEKLMNFCLSDSKIQIACGMVEIFGDFGESYDKLTWKYYQRLYTILDDADIQHWYFVRRNFIPAMAIIYRKDLWAEVGGFDEDVPLLEDWPMWIKVTETGNRIYFTDFQVAKYRLCDSTSVRRSYKFTLSVELFYYKYIIKDMKKFSRLKRNPWMKNRNILTRILHRLLLDDIKNRRPQ